MDLFYALLGLGALLVLALGFEFAQTLNSRRDDPYVFKPDWLKPSERALLAVLEHLLGQDYRVLVRVRANEVLVPDPGLGRRARLQARARLGSYTFSFLICERSTLEVRAAVWLVPQGRRRKEAPDMLERVCARAGLPLLVLPEQAHYALAEIDARLQRLLFGKSMPRASAPDEGIAADEWAALEALARAIEERRSHPP